MRGARWATVLSAVLAAPLLLLLIFVRLDYEPFLPATADKSGRHTHNAEPGAHAGSSAERSSRTRDQSAPPPPPASGQVGAIRPNTGTCHRRSGDAQHRHAHHSRVGTQ